MERNHILGLMAGLALLAADGVRGQDTGELPRHRADVTSLAAQGASVFERDGSLRASGPRYRAVFDADGVSFTPALGVDAPKAMPVSLSLDSVSRGGALVHHPATAPWRAAPEADGARVLFRRTAAITERFTAVRDGLELSWQFDEPLPGDGDLVVRYRVETELVPETGAEGIRLLAPGIGGMSIGTVTGISADGTTCAGGIALQNGVLELSLPAKFVASATYPLVLDPLIGSPFAVRFGSYDTSADVSYDATYNRYLFVWETIFAQTDVEVRGQLTDINGAAVGTANFVIESQAGSTVSMRPRVANVDSSSMFLVVWQRGLSIFGEFDVYCASVHPSTAAVSIPVAISNSSTIDESEPDAGNSRSSDGTAPVVWTERGNGIRAARMSVPSTGAPSFVSTSDVSVSTGPDDHSPAISDGGSSRRVIAFIRPGTLVPRPGTPGTVRARAYNANLLPLGNDIQVASSSTLDAQNVTVDGNGSHFLVAWDYLESSTSGIRNVWCRHLTYDIGLSAGAPAAEAPGFASNAGDDDYEPAVALIGTDATGLKYVLAWTDSGNGNTLNSSVFAITIATDACVECNPIVTVSGASAVNFGPAIASRYQAGENADDCMIATVSADAVPGFDPDIWAARLEAFGSGGATTDLGGGCGLGGTTGVGGPAAVGNTGFDVRLTGATGAIGGVLVLDVSPPIAGTISCGPCVVLAGIATLGPTQFNAVNGTAVSPLPIPCDAGFIGGQLEAQWLTVNLGANPCPLVPSISASNRLRITIGQ